MLLLFTVHVLLPLCVQLPIAAAAACANALHMLLASCLQEDTATPLIAFGVTAIACIVAAIFAVAYAGTAALGQGCCCICCCYCDLLMPMACGACCCILSVWLLHVLRHC